MMEKNSLPSCRRTSFTLSRIPVQSIPSVQPKNGFDHPAGTCPAIISGETLKIAINPMMTDVTVRIVNCMTSVSTTLIMPPLMA